MPTKMAKPAEHRASASMLSYGHALERMDHSKPRDGYNFNA